MVLIFRGGAWAAPKTVAKMALDLQLMYVPRGTLPAQHGTLPAQHGTLPAQHGPWWHANRCMAVLVWLALRTAHKPAQASYIR